MTDKILFEQSENFPALPTRQVSSASKNKFYEAVYSLVSKIPKGKVTTYGEIGKKLHMSPRTVGTALHLNPYEGEVPCHRVVNRDGRIAPGFAFGGIGAQRKLLEAEGIIFKDETHLDLKKYLFVIPE